MGAGADAGALAGVEAEIRAIDSWLGSLRPAKVSFVAKNDSPERSQFLYASEIVDIGVAGVAEPSDLRFGVFVRPILAHEYGHAVFESAFGAIHPEYRNQRQSFNAYDELFADIVAVLHTGRPDAVAESLGVPKVGPWPGMRPDTPEAARPRDFSALIPFKGWRGDRHGYGDYTHYDPARAVLWNLYLAKLDPADRETFLRVFIETVRDHVRHAGDLLKTRTLPNLEADNREFLRIFRRNAEAHGLRANRQASRFSASERMRELRNRPVDVRVSTEEKLDPVDVEGVATEMTAAASFAQGNFVLPREVRFKLVETWHRAGFSINEKTITIPLRYARIFERKLHEKPWSVSKAIAFHEFGHPIFNYNFGDAGLWVRALARAVFAVAFMRNPRAVAEAGYFEGMDAQLARSELSRDFTADTPVAGWASNDPHTALSPVRSFLGRDEGCRSLLVTSPAEFVNLVYRSIHDEMSFLASDGAIEYAALTLEELNERLVRRIQRGSAARPEATAQK